MPDNLVEKTIAKTFMEIANGLETGSFNRPARIAVIGIGSEHGERNVLEGAVLAAKKGIEVTLIGTLNAEGVNTIKAESTEAAFEIMERLLDDGEADGAVAMHYLFPIGVSTVGRAVAPGTGKEMFMATTTGTSSLDRAAGMVKNTIFGIIAAKACGIGSPSVGLLNIDGARQTENALRQLKKNGYDICFASSGREDGGCIMRGNDLLAGTSDVMVCDSLTGNILMKSLSAFTTGGSYESVGWGYGPGIGEEYNRLIMIASRASGAPVIAGAIEYAAQLIRGKFRDIAKKEFAAANKAGLKNILESMEKPKAAVASEEVSQPPKEVVTDQITGIEIMSLDDATKALWKEGIYAESGMGCTGPVVLVSHENLVKAEEILRQGNWIAE